MKRHVRENYYVVNEGILTYDDQKKPTCYPPSDEAGLRKFRFSRMGREGAGPRSGAAQALANAMTPTAAAAHPAPPAGPGGFTYLGQFVDHDLTLDRTSVSLGENGHR